MNKEDIKSFLKDNIDDSACLNAKFERLDNYFKQEIIQKTNDILYIAILKVILLCCNENDEIDTDAIIKNIECYCEEFKLGVKKNNLRLADKCFNQCNDTGCIKIDDKYQFNIERYNKNPHFFEKVEGGFKVISEYNGPIVEKHRDVPDKIVAYWQDGQIVENISSTDLLEETIIKYAEFKNSDDYDEQYKYDYARENKGLFDNLNGFEEKITKLKHRNLASFFIGRCSGLKHLTDNYMGELKEAFGVLFSSDDLENRLRTFKNILNEKLIKDENWRNNDILVDVQTASYFLFINDYEKNLLFTSMKPFNKFSKMFGLSDLEKYKSDEERYIKWQEYCKNTLLPKMDGVLNKKHTLLDAQDLIWFVDNNLKDNTTKEEQKEEKEPMEELNIPKNQILYGPPGTGKTYNTVIKAMEIINKNCIEYDNEGNVRNYDVVKEEFDKLKESGQIEFVTFHQSYSYEEFVEGIKPKLNSNDLGYIREDGIFKNICDNALFDSLDILEEDSQSSLEFNQIIEIFKENYPVETIIETEKSSFKIFDYLDTSIRVSPVDGGNTYSVSYQPLEEMFKIHLTNPYTMPKNLSERFGAFKGLSTYYFNILEKLREIYVSRFDKSQKVQVEYTNEQKSLFIKKYLRNEIEIKETTKPYVLIIDEINRGDVSKIFGELITLIEEDKRLGAEYAMTTTLPYSKESFGVPSNLFIIGTMNTADRSIALLDTALRRRFDFEEMMPRPELLKNREVKDINLQTLLTRINERIEKEYDRDHQIGHSYLMGVNNEKELERAYKNRILPLLNEYFYNDTESVAKILNWKVEELKDDFLKVLKNAQSNDNNKQ